MPCDEVTGVESVIRSHSKGSESDALIAIDGTGSTRQSSRAQSPVHRVYRFKASFVLATVLGCGVLLGCLMHKGGDKLRRRKHIAAVDDYAVDCSQELTAEDMRVLSDSDPCKTPKQLGDSAAALQAEMKSLQEKQQKLLEAAHVAAFKAKIERGECSAGAANCNATKCCNSPGAQCFTQTKGGYAQCRQTCKRGKDPTHWDSVPWDCEPVGERTPGKNTCSDMHENCIDSQCCNDLGLQCYQKNSTYGSCKLDCVAGSPDMSDKDGKPWTCKELGSRSPSTAGWVWGECAKEKENCGTKQCCSEAGMQCYAQTDNPQTGEVFWGLCMEQCNPGKDPRKPWEKAWSCNEVGTRTPTAPQKGDRVEKWALEPGACSSNSENCKDTRCCLGVDVQCYEKNKDYAQCRRWCEPGEGPVNDTWTCAPLSTRSWGLATKGWPSLFCFSLTRTQGYEMGILRHQYDKKIGIFECDHAAVLSADGVVELAPGGLKTMKVKPAEITTSQDGTAGNAKLFVNVWNAIIEDGQLRNYAFTIKVDPDAVIMPARMRQHMATHTGEKFFVVNCNKFSNSPNFPMMYGAVEIFSNKAMEEYAAKKDSCLTDMGMMLPKWGEDFFMTRCMDHIGVGRVGDWYSLGDQLCLGANCADPRSASYHPFKDLASWSKCHDTAVATEPH